MGVEHSVEYNMPKFEKLFAGGASLAESDATNIGLFVSVHLDLPFLVDGDFVRLEQTRLIPSREGTIPRSLTGIGDLLSELTHKSHGAVENP
jgi:hypothetical protein